MTTSDALYRFSVEERELIVRGVDQTIRGYWRRAGALVTPTPGTVTVKDASGTAIVDAEAFTVTGDVAEYTISAATTASLPLEGGWVVRWTATMPDGTTRTDRNEALLVREVLSPPASERDLYRLQARLDPSHTDPYTIETDWSDKLDEAWRQIEDRLVQGGRRPELVMSPASFRLPHALLTLALIFEDLRSGAYDRWEGMAQDYRKQFEARWSGLSFSYDEDEDGLIDGGAEPVKTSSQSSVWLTSRR